MSNNTSKSNVTPADVVKLAEEKNLTVPAQGAPEADTKADTKADGSEQVETNVDVVEELEEALSLVGKAKTFVKKYKKGAAVGAVAVVVLGVAVKVIKARMGVDDEVEGVLDDESAESAEA